MKILSLVAGFLACLVGFSAVAAPSVALTWTPPTTFTNGAPISGAITYNIYQGVTGAEKIVQSGVSSTAATVTAGLTVGQSVCFYVTAVVAAVESAPSVEGCNTVTAPKPGVPGSLIIIITP